MSFHQLPEAQGLYSPEFEHDACGIGLYANMKGKASHEIVKNGLEMLCRLEHRAGRGADGKTGDGAGLMVQIPHAFFKLNCPELALPEKGQYGVGQLFFTEKEEERREIEQKMNELIEQEGQQLIGWRSAPTNKKNLSDVAKCTAPVVRQVFIGANAADTLAFERKLYVIRKQVEHWAEAQGFEFYCPSMSSQTMVFKGLLSPEEVSEFYIDLQDESFISAIALVHSRYSTNTFPSWKRAHPNRYIIHNGEINTLRGNINWMRAREQQFVFEAFGDDLEKILPLIDTTGSDSSMLDNAFEFFVLAGRTPVETAMMLIPEPWTENLHISDERRAFYQYHASLMEPWDGPTAVCYTDGKQIGAILDRNGLRPGRYYVTKDDHVIFSSEVGVVDVEEENVLYKECLSPGRVLLIDLEEGRIISDDELKEQFATAKPYAQWIEDNMLKLEVEAELPQQITDLALRQKMVGYTYEDVQKYIVPLTRDGKDPLGSMGFDSPLAVLSERPQSLFNYFKQLFAQVTNPPIDSIREHVVTSTMTMLGAEGDLLHPNEKNARRILLDMPVLTNAQYEKLVNNTEEDFQVVEIPLLFTEDLESSLNKLILAVEAAIFTDKTILVLTDYLTEVTRSLLDSNFVDGKALNVVGRDVIVIDGGDTGADCVATAIRQNCKSVVQFGKHPQQALTRTDDTMWPKDPNVYKLDYAYAEADAKYGRDPREYCLQTKFIEKDAEGNVKALHTIQMEKLLGEDGFHYFKELPGTERVWPAQYVFVAIGFEGTELELPTALGVDVANNRIRASIKDFETNVPGIFAAGDARRGQSLIVWAIKEGRGVAASVHTYLQEKAVTA